MSPHSLTITGPACTPARKAGTTSKSRRVVGREAGHLAFNREETQDAARIARGIGSNRPADDHLVADIGVHRAAVVTDRSVDIEKEARDEVVHPKLAHCFGKARRVSDIEKHHDQLLANRTMVGPQNDACEKRAADQPPRLGHHADNQGDNRKAISDDLLGRATVSQSGVSQSR